MSQYLGYFSWGIWCCYITLSSWLRSAKKAEVQILASTAYAPWAPFCHDLQNTAAIDIRQEDEESSSPKAAIQQAVANSPQSKTKQPQASGNHFEKNILKIPNRNKSRSHSTGYQHWNDASNIEAEQITLLGSLVHQQWYIQLL